MIRLTLFLCACLFVALLVLGEDRGQRRAGLLAADTGPLATTKVVEAAAASTAPEPLNLPAQPVIQAAAAPVPAEDPLAEAVAAEVAAAVSVPVDEPAEAIAVEAETEEGAVEGTLRWIAADAVNVREGPSTDHPIVDKLTRGEAVLVVLEEGGGEGWSRVRIEGDGVEGFVASRFLADAQP
jgi:uncharacterized protein YgiM (DUF1202 family)